jgi:predicted secreted protein
MFYIVGVVLFVILCHFAGKWYYKKQAQTRHTDVQHFLLSEHHNNSSITIPPDSGVVVSLPFNGSTGYDWEIVQDPKHILTMMNERQYMGVDAQDENGEFRVGGGTTVFYRFYATAEGTGTIKLVNRQPWMPLGEGHETYYEVNITVKKHCAKTPAKQIQVALC